MARIGASGTGGATTFNFTPSVIIGNQIVQAGFQYIVTGGFVIALDSSLVVNGKVAVIQA